MSKTAAQNSKKFSRRSNLVLKITFKSHFHLKNKALQVLTI